MKKKEEKKTKTENTGNFRKPAKFRSPLHQILYQTSIDHNFFFPNSDSCVLGLYEKIFESRI